MSFTCGTCEKESVTSRVSQETGLKYLYCNNCDKKSVSFDVDTDRAIRVFTPESEGVKHDNNKPDMSLLSTKALLEISKVMDFGKKKYSANNWRKGMQWSRLIAAALRHITAFNDGEDIDSETGISHLAHAGCCIMFLLEYEKTQKEKDDRYSTCTD